MSDIQKIINDEGRRLEAEKFDQYSKNELSPARLRTVERRTRAEQLRPLVVRSLKIFAEEVNGELETKYPDRDECLCVYNLYSIKKKGLFQTKVKNELLLTVVLGGKGYLDEPGSILRISRGHQSGTIYDDCIGSAEDSEWFIHLLAKEYAKLLSDKNTFHSR